MLIILLIACSLLYQKDDVNLHVSVDSEDVEVKVVDNITVYYTFKRWFPWEKESSRLGSNVELTFLEEEPVSIKVYDYFIDQKGRRVYPDDSSYDFSCEDEVVLMEDNNRYQFDLDTHNVSRLLNKYGLDVPKGVKPYRGFVLHVEYIDRIEYYGFVLKIESD